jgi:spore maturation protein CgeB
VNHVSRQSGARQNEDRDLWSSLLSAYWNGAAIYYRGILRALAPPGHDITFFEPDAFDRQSHRDIDPHPGAAWSSTSRPKPACATSWPRPLGPTWSSRPAGVGVFDDALLDGILTHAAPGALRLFWDVDASVTLAELAGTPDHALRRALPHLDFVLTYGGGNPVVSAYRGFGARDCIPVYNALDLTAHHPVPPQPRFAADLTFLGNRLPDREHRVEAFFLAAAAHLPQQRFLLGGSGWHDRPCPANVIKLGHVPTSAHNALNTSARAVLNISRDSMASTGFSPATRVFEAAGAGACLLTDAWAGIEMFLTPDKEVLVARDGTDVAEAVRTLTAERAREIGQAALRRVLAEHTYDRRAATLHRLLTDLVANRKTLQAA